MRRASFSFLALAVTLRMLALAQTASAGEETDRWAASEYARLSEKYDVEIILTNPPFEDGISGKAASTKNVTTFLALFKAEWSFYPPELVAESGLRRIIFCEDLTSQGHIWGGLASGGKGDYLYINVGTSRWSKMYIRNTIHHEFFHVIDRRMHINAGIRYGFKDPQWAALNPEGFKYDLKLQIVPNGIQNDPKLKGFLNKYAQSDVAEDKAEVYSYMITEGQIIDDRIKTDPVLKAKTERMKELVKQLSPKMDDDFWKAARKVNRQGG